ERTLTVNCNVTRRSSSEAVVEDFQRNEPVETSCLEGVHERVDVKLALPGKAAVMTAPGQIVHVELWRVGHLDQEDAVLRNGAHRIEVGAAREHVEGVEHKPDGRMISAAHHLPGVAIVVDVSSPRERFERDATASPRRSLAELAEIRRCAVNAAEGI